MLDDLLVSKTLVIGPLRVARDTWPSEVEKWEHLQDLDVSVIVGDVKARTAALNHNALVYVINRENVKWLVEYYEKNGLRWDFDCVVIDELSSFKNYQSQRFKRTPFPCVCEGHQFLMMSGTSRARIYRIKFGRDIYKDLAKLENSVSKNKEESSEIDIPSLEMFENIAYVMSKHADPSLPDTPEEWLDEFNTFSIYQVLPSLIELWGLNMKRDVQAKKAFAQLTEK